MSEYTTTEALLFDGEPRTPSRNAASDSLQLDTETIFKQETCRERRSSTLRLDTRVAEPMQSGSRRVSPSSDSPASSTSAHSRHDSTASYTPLRSARGSLSLGGTAHHSILSHRSSPSHSAISREALALPLADTDTLILVPDAVVTRSPLCTQTDAECAEPLQDQTPRLIPHRRRKHHRHIEIRNTSIMTGTLCILLIVASSISNPDVVIAIPRVNDIPTSIHVCIIGTFLVVAAFILLFSIRLHKAISRYRDKGAAVTTSPWRAVRPTEAEQSLIPNSPIAVQYEYDDDGDVEVASQQSPMVLRSPPPAYGRWRGSWRMDPELLHWRRVKGGGESEGRGSGDVTPPVYASPLRIRHEDVGGGTEMVEVGRMR
ncbi:hypothetical protein E4T44_05356 [Aureobasidium sp. EXF-8845]|nr:hypothetical protein E4T44_05356 [Aureobasidium sp. EXF-8845]KAI4847166.1 hypothetical protein E4T45_06903 [Aureobasidium sp. EXF-8846]